MRRKRQDESAIQSFQIQIHSRNSAASSITKTVVLPNFKPRREKLKSQPCRLIFGGKKLWKAQFHLEANQYSSLEEWRQDWDKQRHNQFVCVGKALDRQGNRSVQWFGDGTLRLSVPPALRVEFGEFVEVTEVTFPYGQNDIEAALHRGQALTHRLIFKDDVWYLHTTVERSHAPLKTHRQAGMMGIDLNPKEVGWAIADSQGNLIKSGSIPYDLTNKTANQAEHILALVVKELVQTALDYQVPITVEKLDFTEKKRNLREKGKRYSKMLSGFAYAKFDQLLTSRCEREGAQLIHKNAAWSSLIGMVKFMKRYGMSSATAAALAMARRGQRHSERLPARYAKVVPGGKLPPRTHRRLLQVDGNRHVWGHWGTFKKKLVLGFPRHSFFCLSALEQALEGKLTGGRC